MVETPTPKARHRRKAEPDHAQLEDRAGNRNRNFLDECEGKCRRRKASQPRQPAKPEGANAHHYQRNQQRQDDQLPGGEPGQPSHLGNSVHNIKLLLIYWPKQGPVDGLTKFSTLRIHLRPCHPGQSPPAVALVAGFGGEGRGWRLGANALQFGKQLLYIVKVDSDRVRREPVFVEVGV